MPGDQMSIGERLRVLRNPAIGTALLSTLVFMIGSSPLMRWFWLFLVVGPGLVLLAFCLFSVGGAGAGVGIIVVIGALPWAIAMMAICVKLLVLLLSGGGLHYRRTKAALAAARARGIKLSNPASLHNQLGGRAKSNAAKATKAAKADKRAASTCFRSPCS